MAQQNDPHLNEVERELLADVAKAYGLSDLNRAQASRDAWDGRIQIAFSAGHRRYLLKQWPRYCRSDEELRFVLAVQDCAREGGVPVPPILVTKEGRRVFDWRDRRFSLQHFVGRSYDPERPMQILSCAETLGQYHRAVADAQIDGDGWGIVSLSRHHLDVLSEAVAERQLSEDDKRRVRQVIVQLYEMLTIAEGQMESLGWADLDAIPVHGDYHQFNCRFKGDRVAAIIDFDNSRLEPRIYDIAYALDMMLGLDWRREPEKEYLWRNTRLLRPEIIGSWMTAYSRYAPPLSDAEIRLLPWVCAAVWPEAIHGFLPKTAAEVSGCEKVAGCMRHLLEDAPILSEHISTIENHVRRDPWWTG